MSDPVQVGTKDTGISKINIFPVLIEIRLAGSIDIDIEQIITQAVTGKKKRCELPGMK